MSYAKTCRELRRRQTRRYRGLPQLCEPFRIDWTPGTLARGQVVLVPLPGRVVAVIAGQDERRQARAREFAEYARRREARGAI